MTLKLLNHEGQHGFGVSLVKYNDQDELLIGFVLIHLKTKEERDEYAENLKEILGIEKVEYLYP